MDSRGENDFTLRDDVLLFNDALTQSGHNIKNYRKRHQQLAKRSDRLIPPSTETAQPHFNNFISTIDNSNRQQHTDEQEKMKLNLDRLTMRRKSFTAGGSRKKSNEPLKTQARTLHVGNMRQNMSTSKNKTQVRENKYKSIEKDFNKGPLKQKYLECWLNSILLQACFEQKFDMTVENPALKKFQLDRNSLLSKGIKISHLSRLYKSLFVYSVGFNDLLNEICNNNMNLRKAIWKVYVILLQYCAQGSFQMMIAEIERDKTRKVQGLRSQIQKRQWIIENNEEINEQKNAKIYKEIKYLKEENENLLNEKEILLEQFKQAQQAFNQQVSLRLKFENRINQIHGVYTEIKMKHERLLTDFETNQNQLFQLRKWKQQTTGLMIQIKSENQKKTQELANASKELKYHQELVGELQGKKGDDTEEIIGLKNKIKGLTEIIQEKDRQINQKQKHYQNIQLLFQTEKKEHQLKSKQFLASLDQNSRLHHTIQQQMKQLNVLYIQTRNFGAKTSQIKAESIIATRKLNQMAENLKQTQEKLTKQLEETKKIQTMYDKELQHREQLEKDLQQCYTQIKEMRQAKNNIQESLETNLKKINIIDEIIDGKDKQIELRNQRIYELEEANAQNTNLIKANESKIKMLNQKINSDQQINDKKLKAIKEERDKITTLYQQFDNMKKQLELELDKYKQLYEDTHVSLKNQLFQRSNLDILYKQSLNVMEHQNNHIKELNIQKSQLNEEIFSLRRNIKNMEYIHAEKQKQFVKDKNFWEKEIETLAVFNRDKKQYVHPMVLEDIAGNYAYIKSQYTVLNEKYHRETNDLKKNLEQARKEMKYLKENNKKDLKNIEIKYQSVINKKDNQITYEQQRRIYFYNKNKQLEERMEKITSGKLLLTSQAEQKYLNHIREKSQKIDDLLTQLESAHDQNARLRQNFASLSEALPQKQKQLQQMQILLQQVKKKWQDQILKGEEAEKEYLKAIATENKQRNQNQNNMQSHKKENKERKKSSARERSAKSQQKYQTINWKDKQQTAQLLHGDDKRSDFVRKYKGAFSYYHK